MKLNVGNQHIIFIYLDFLYYSFIKILLISSSINKKSNWAIVRNGAVSEFSIASNDKHINQYFDNFTNILTVETNKAILKLKLDNSITPIFFIAMIKI